MRRFLDWISFFEPYIIGIIPALVVVMFLSGCATAGYEQSGKTRDLTTTAVTTTAGAYVGAKEGDGKAKNAAVGAAVGFVVGEGINYFNNKAQREAFVAGYEKGQSDSVKQQYWVARDNQRPSQDDGYEEALYEIPVPQSDADGVRREPTKRVIRIVVPKEEEKS
ncbi:MAG: YMGG-like glycine zipper-containing protein [Opitutaceae bacterium]|nr:YMGG-like glycine zipper-containing protein [Opitutaceae bacterium]